ncbi:MAG TPA: hypothetical protein VM938_01485 [Acidimicrobiales bacterium]|nr:hypothetical protein [Acidimicrobiales bacterium]
MNAAVAVATLGLGMVTAGVTASVVIGKYRERVDTLRRDFDRLNEKCEGMKSQLDQLAEFKLNTQKFIDSKIYQQGSPLNLTDYGQKLVAESGFAQIFPSVRDELVLMLEKQSPTSQYDVQEKARALMDGLTGYEPFKPIEQYAFNSGSDFGQILRAGAILLRDYYFERHPELVNPNERW